MISFPEPVRLPAGSRGTSLALALCLLAAAWFHAGHAAAGERSRPGQDSDGNGIEDVLDRWLSGQLDWPSLRQAARHTRAPAGDESPLNGKGASVTPAPGYWSEGLVRVIILDPDRSGTRKAALAGRYIPLHQLETFGPVQVAACDGPALRALLETGGAGRILLDREGLPALDASRPQVGADQIMASHWRLGQDWSATVAILDSGCDTAHGDLGDYADDNVDGPAPEVGDAADWYPASSGWPLFQSYKVVGWHDVTDDFPSAQGPWDYHHHGTALASVVAGSGTVDPRFKGLNPGGRLTVVKFYDFDDTWHTWAGDFLAACAWVLENRETYRVRTVLAAVNWEADLGLSDAMSAFVDAGIVPVVAMGNFGNDPAGPGYPARLSDVLAVGSVSDSGAVSAFSGRGLPDQPKPDLLAPGGSVLAADNEPNDTYSLRQGTSLAAAHVAGAINLLDEALVDNGLHLPRDRQGALTRMALIQATAGRVDLAEDPDGGPDLLLPPHDEPDPIRGWGLLRADAAVRAALLPLFPGQDQADTLSAGSLRPVSTRRLVLSPGVRYLIEAVPQAGLDVALQIIQPAALDGADAGLLLPGQNANGAGVSEFLYHHAEGEDWAFLVVRRVSGGGTVSLRVNEADDFVEPSLTVQLPGNLTGAPNVGRLVGSVGPTIVVPSRVEVDHVARSVNVLDATGVALPGWPVFVFPQSSAQGGLSQPVVWDLDGTSGDEIVLSSGFGSVYFFNRLGAWNRVDLGFNDPLTTPVGVLTADGQRRVVVLDSGGVLRSWSWGPVLETEKALGHPAPLSPAVGQIVAGEGEEIAVAFATGTVLVTDAEGNSLPGWPVNIGQQLEIPPVLCDFDLDGLHDIILPDLDPVTGILSFHVLKGDGQPGPGDGQTVAAPAGGRWRKLSTPVVAGRYGTGDLRVSLSGLMDNGQTGTGARWFLGVASLQHSGQAGARTLSGFEVAATTSQGVLTLQKALLPGPLAWDFTGGTGTDEAFLFGVDWTELIYGLTAIGGSAAGWLRPTVIDRPLEGRSPIRPGGAAGTSLTVLGSLLVDMESEVFLQVQVLDDILQMIPQRDGYAASPCWPSVRGDQRNTAAYPLRQDMSPVPVPAPQRSSLAVYPNPGSGRFSFRLTGDQAGRPVEVRVFDLRGRHVRTMRAASMGALPAWDARDEQGRLVAAGTYLAIARQDGRQATARFVVTR